MALTHFVILFSLQFSTGRCLYYWPTKADAGSVVGITKGLVPTESVAPADLHRQAIHPLGDLEEPDDRLYYPPMPHPDFNAPYNPLVDELGRPFWTHNNPMIPPPFPPPPPPPLLPPPPPPSAMPGFRPKPAGMILSQSGPESTNPFDPSTLSWRLNKTMVRPLVLLITGKGVSKEVVKGRKEKNIFLHVDLDGSQIKALRPEYLDSLNLHSPTESRWLRLLAKRILNKFKSSYNLVIVPSRKKKTNFLERREEKVWSSGDEEIPSNVDIRHVINPR